MATESLLKALQAKQRLEGISLRALARELGVSHVLLSGLFQGKRSLTKEVSGSIEQLLLPKPSPSLTQTLDSFIRSSARRSNAALLGQTLGLSERTE